MKRKLQLLKTLLVAVGLLAGASDVWADEVIGTTSSDWNAAYSTTVTMADGGVQHYRFTQTTAAANNFDGFILIASNVSNGSRYAFMRQDWYDGEGTAGTFDYNYDTENFIAGMNGATVDMTITYSSGTLTMNSLVTYKTNYSYYYNYTKTIDGSPESINVCLSTYHAQLTITTSEYYDVKATLSHTASLARNNTANPVYSKDAATERYNNRASGGWQGFAYAEFDFAIPTGHSLVSADLIWTTAIEGNNNNWRNNNIDYMSAAVDYDSFSSQTNGTVNNFNTSETLITNVSLYSGPYSKENAQAQTATTDVTSAIRAMISADKSTVIFRFTDNPAGAYLWGKASKYAPVLVLKTTDEVLYTATFTETNSLSPTVTIYSDALKTEEVANGNLSDATTYYYTATLEGYNDYEGSFTVAGADPSESFTMTAKTRYTFTINAIDETSGVIKVLYTDADSYVGKSHSVSFPKYLTGVGNVVTHSKDDATYYANYTAQAQDETYTQAYTTYTDMAYFFEGESFSAKLGSPVNSGNYSSNTAARGLNNNTLDVMTISAIGTYSITYAACSNNVNANRTYALYQNDSEHVIDTQSCNWSVSNVKTSGTITVNNVSLSAGDVIQFYAGDSNVILDYVLIKLASVSTTLDAQGYATFASPYALDVTSMTATSGTVTAYKAAVSETTVNFTALDQTIPANTGVLLKGDASATVTIPVVATGTAVSENAFLVNEDGTTFAGDGDYYYFAMKKNSNPLTFAAFDPNTLAFPATKAYLKVLKSNFPTPAPTLTVTFDGGNTTGINAVKNAQRTENGEYYNLAGQRVAQPTKGLYIVNGRKVVVK